MARCGADYWELIRTSYGGTPEEPLSGLSKVAGIAGPEDWYAWHSLAETLHDRAEDQFRRLGEVESEKLGGKNWPEWNRNIAAQNDLHAAWEAMGSFWTTSATNGIPQAIRVCEAAVCLMEGVDRSLAVYGESSMVAKGPIKATTMDTVIAVGILGAIAFAVYKADKAED